MNTTFRAFLAPAVAASLIACSAPVATAQESAFEEITLPAAPDPDEPRQGRVPQIYELLYERAAEDARAMGDEEPIPYAMQVGYQAESYLVGAISPGGGVFYVAPFLGPYPSGNIDPWERAIVEDGQVRFDACRFEIIPDSLPGNRRFAKVGEITSLWPDPLTCELQEEAGEPADLPENAQPYDDGYEMRAETGEPDGARAAIVVHPGNVHSRFNADAALDLYLDGREVAWSMALPIARWTSAVAELTDGTRIYLANPSQELARICIFEGVDWATFRSFAGGADHPLRSWCDAGLSEHRAEYMQRLMEDPPPRIVAEPLR
ncbi:hypothetical protein [Aurantiacibacter sediminis]|uniref:Uncharacterized protein n=1 Tax=Aurantiacibacter sediminis TaxID=2793064 RepID=A0ABS0N6D2_9SPHN|nr:hypothetical protein [Aurantiacibacter sediminis]MBH5323320.1 hypothetical protein [Aurantiacibacter sediminis]